MTLVAFLLRLPLAHYFLEAGNPPCEVLRALALPYADHPDYHDEWRP